MYNEDKGVLGASIAAPTILGLTIDKSLGLYIALATFITITAFYVVYRKRNATKK